MTTTPTAPSEASHSSPQSTATQAHLPARVETNGFSRIFSSPSNRDFLVFWFGMIGSFLAMQMQQVARGFLAYDISGSATSLGLVTLSFGAPMLVLSPLGGVLADRIPKRNTLIATQAVMGITTLVNAVLISAHVIEIWHLVVIGLLQGCTFAFNMPARQSVIPEIVGPQQMANAIAINSAGMNLTRVLGPTLAGIMIGIPFLGTAGAFYFMAACYLAVTITLFQVPVTTPLANANRPRGSISSELTSGMRYIWNDPVLRTLIGMAFAPVLLGMPYQSLMPVFAKEVFQQGSEGLGLLLGAVGLGALAGSLLVAYFSASPNKRQFQLVSGIIFGLALVLFAIAPNFLLGMAALLVVGAASNIYMALNNTLILESCDSSMHGRVMSVYLMTFSLMPLTTMPMSTLVDFVGSRITIGAAGVLTAVAIAALAVGISRSRTRV